MSNDIPVNYDPGAIGCTSCGSQETVTLDGRFGRRCSACSPWKSLAAEGKFPEAWLCLRSWLAVREHDAGGAA